jgi:cell division protein FtsA
MNREQNNLIAGLDIGSSFVRIAVGNIMPQGRNDQVLQILGITETPSEGVNKGIITGIEDVVSSVSACLEQAERLVGAPIENITAGISGVQTIIQDGHGYVVVSKSDNEIIKQDVDRAIETSKSVATPLNYEVLHVAPRSFIVDGQNGIKDPVGMTGVRLEVDTKIVLGQSSQIKNLTRAIYRTGLEIDAIVLSILANAELLLSSKQKELGVALINIGASTTSIVVYEEGELLHLAVIPAGSAHISNDLAVGLRAPVDLVERVKLQYEECLTGSFSKRRGEIDLFDFGASDHDIFKLKDVSLIIQARVEEIMSLIDNELKKIKKSGMLPAGAVFTGGGAKLPGMVEIGKNILRLPVFLARPTGFISASDQTNDPSYSTAVGLIKYTAKSLDHEGSGGFWKSVKSSGRKVLGVKDFFKSLIP